MWDVSLYLHWRIKYDKLTTMHSAQAEGKPFFDKTQPKRRADAESLFEVFTKE